MLNIRYGGTWTQEAGSKCFSQIMRRNISDADLRVLEKIDPLWLRFGEHRDLTIAMSL